MLDHYIRGVVQIYKDGSWQDTVETTLDLDVLGVTIYWHEKGYATRFIGKEASNDIKSIIRCGIN